MLEVFTTSQCDDKIAVVNGNRSYSYKEIKGLIASQIIYLRNKKDNIVLLSDDNFGFIINFFASIFAGKSISLVTDRNRLYDLDFEYDVVGSFEDSYKYDFKFQQADEKEVVINFYTSGSSGKAKNIKKSLWNLVSEGNDLGEVFKIPKNTSVLSTTTMCHLFGMTFHLMFSLCNGLVINTNTVAYPENVNVENAILVSTPAFLKTKVKHNLDFGILPKYIISAGSKLDEGVFETLEKESSIIEIYGSTETGVIGYKTKHDEAFTIFPNVKIKANEEDLEVESDYMYGGKCVINDKVENSGNRLIVKNRTDRLFKIYDKRVSAQELEEKLNIHEYVENSYITNLENKLVCLCALSEKGKEVLLSKNVYPVTKDLKLHMLKYSEIIPQKWKFIDIIPMNKMGKIDKNLIEHIFNVNLSLPVILDRKRDGDSVTYKIFMYKNCNFFNGHFPKFKIVPGVLQLYLAKEFANAHFGLNIGQEQIKRIKFVNMIEPDTVLYLNITKTEKQVSYEYYSDEKKYSSGTFDIINIF